MLSETEKAALKALAEKANVSRFKDAHSMMVAFHEFQYLATPLTILSLLAEVGALTARIEKLRNFLIEEAPDGAMRMLELDDAQ